MSVVLCILYVNQRINQIIHGENIRLVVRRRIEFHESDQLNFRVNVIEHVPIKYHPVSVDLGIMDLG